MFEDSTFESGSRIKTRSGRWMTLTGLLNGAILVLLILVPLIYPDALPRAFLLTVLTVPPAPPPQAAPAPKTQISHASSEMMDRQLMAPARIPASILMVGKPEAPPAPMDVASAPGLGVEAPALTGGAGSSRIQVAPAKPQLAISSGVAEGMLIRKTLPVYPVIAREARVSGTVVLSATIGKSGTIQELRVVSGPPMLQGAAMDAVKTWIYRPYLLNGQPVDVQTTVLVTFSLGG